MKIRLPPAEVTAEWDSDTKKEFGGFRADIKDLFQSSYVLLGHDMVEKLVFLTIQSIQARNWWEIEASIFSLNALADTLAEEVSDDLLLAQVLGSSLFGDLANLGHQVPAKVHRTAVDMLGHFSQFFVRHVEYLPAALNFLFSSLAAASLANTASRSIASLCSSCRKSLIPELNAFLQQYESFLSWPTADAFTKEKVIGAIAAIIQALPSDELKDESLQRLLTFIERDVGTALQCIASGASEDAQVSAVAAFKCMASIGRAFRAQDEIAIDLEAEEKQPNYWADGPGAALQQRIILCIKTLTETLMNHSEVTEAACDVLRSGLTETTPGPFVLPPYVTVGLLLRSTLETPSLGTILTTACVLLRTYTPSYTPPIQQEAVSIFRHVSALIQELAQPSTDPEIAQNCIDVIARFTPRYTDVMFLPDLRVTLEQVLRFSIECLIGDDLLPKRSSSSFWVFLTGDPCLKLLTEVF